MTTRIKRQVDGGVIFRSATGAWTFRLTGETFWRQEVHLDTEAQVMAALREAVAAKLTTDDLSTSRFGIRPIDQVH